MVKGIEKESWRLSVEGGLTELPIDGMIDV